MSSAPRKRTVRGLATQLTTNLESSDCIIEPLPGAKKSDRPHTSRGLSARLAASNNLPDKGDTDDVGIYSDRVSRIWSNAAPCIPTHDSLSATVTITSDVEEKKTDEVQLISSSKLTLSSLDSAPLDDEDCSPSRKPKDPTPPPSPSTKNVRCRRTKRMPKEVKIAMTKLQKAQKFLNAVDVDEDDGDDDIVILDSSSARALSPSKDQTMTVKVRSHSGIHRHEMKIRDSFAEVISFMASKENVSADDIIMFLNDRTVHEYDSPKSLQLTVADIIECRVRGSDPTAPDCEPTDNGSDDPMLIQLVFQSTGSRTSKDKTALRMRKDDPMEKVMRQYCHANKIKYDTVVFLFDGDVIDPASTPESLDLESDYCIDVKPH